MQRQTCDWIPFSPSTMYLCVPKHKALTWEEPSSLSFSLWLSVAAKPHSSGSCHFLHLLHWRGFTCLYRGIYLAFLWWNITQRHRAPGSPPRLICDPAACRDVTSGCGFCFRPSRRRCRCYNSGRRDFQRRPAVDVGTEIWYEIHAK